MSYLIPHKAASFKSRLLLVLLLATLCTEIWAQKPTKVELMQANTLEFDKNINKNVRRLIGDVILKHDETIMHCDSAYLYTESNNFDAFGKIHIKVSDSVDIWGGFLKYTGNTKLAELHHDVKMVDNQTTLTSEHLFYDLKNDMAYYNNKGYITNAQNNLKSNIGRYYSNSKMFFFKDSVELINPDYTIYSDTLQFNTITEVAYFFGPTTILSDSNEIYCEDGWYDTQKDISQFTKNAYLKNNHQILRGDSLFYDRNEGYGKALHNVSIVDKKESLVVYGQFGEYFEKIDYAMVTQKAYLVKAFDNDSLYLHADTLKSKLDTCGEKRILLGYKKVRFYKQDLQGLCDSIVFLFSDSTINMYGLPIVWNEENQITAQFIKIILQNNTIKEMHMQTSSFIVSQEDSSSYNQIKGKDMIGFFDDDKLYRIDVFGNGQTVYYVKEEDNTKTGINVSESSEMSIFLNENQVDKILFRSKPDATLYPVDDIPEALKLLKDFNWFDYLRPLNKDDIFIWKERTTN